jgi:hypothetical protein
MTFIVTSNDVVYEKDLGTNTSALARMWIVRLALRRPYTFIVMAILIAIMGGLSIVTRRPIFFRTSIFRWSA